MQYDFSEDEVKAVLHLLDVAVKATGLQFAGNAGALAAKFQAPFLAAAAQAQAEAPKAVATKAAAPSTPDPGLGVPRRGRKAKAANGHADEATA